MTRPRVFISHATEDKKRFVLDFATKLREKGIDAWVDEWEMHPGDLLVDKIFEEGIKNAQAMIVVLSKYSVNKRWVQEELNAGMIKRIQYNSKLIPVLIDDCEVPECLKSTVWVKIQNLEDYDVEFQRIVLSIYGKLDKPPLGSPPPYTRTLIDIIPGLTELDSLVLKVSCEKAIEIGYPFIETEQVIPLIESTDIHRQDIFESLDILEHKMYIKLVRPMSVDPPAFTITVYGFEEYARIYIDQYDSILESVGYHIVNNNGGDDESISESLKQPQMIIRHILHRFDNRSLIKVFEGNGGFMMVTSVSPELKRILNKS